MRIGSIGSDRIGQPSATRLLACVSEIESWMSSNRLKLNASKTEFTWIGTRQQLSKVEEEALMVCRKSVTPMVKVRNLGVFNDQELTMEVHVSIIVRGCRLHVPTSPTPQRQAVADPRQPARALIATAFVASVASTIYTATVSYNTVSRNEKFSDFEWGS